MKYYIKIIILILILCSLYSFSNKIIYKNFNNENFNNINIFNNEKIKIIIYVDDYKYLIEYINSILPNNEIILYGDKGIKITDPSYYYISIRQIPYYTSLKNKIKVPDYNINWNVEDDFPTNYSELKTPEFSDDCKVGFINTEQYSRKSQIAYNKTCLSPNIDIYDYSLENISLYGKGIYLPYKENKEETKILKSYMNVMKEYDVCFIGELSKRRTKIIEE